MDVSESLKCYKKVNHKKYWYTTYFRILFYETFLPSNWALVGTRNVASWRSQCPACVGEFLSLCIAEEQLR